MIISQPFSVVLSADTTKDVDVSGFIVDARNSVPALYDSSGDLLSLQLQATSASVIRIASDLPLTGTYTLMVVGTAIPTPPSPAPAVGGALLPSLSVFSTYGEARDKLLVDLDLEEEEDADFISPAELIGYFNEGIKEAESEILKLDEDYFLTSQPLPLAIGQQDYAYPSNIYGYKERGIQWVNGTEIYPVKPFRRNHKFDHMAIASQQELADTAYRWQHINDAPGKARIRLIPAARENAILPPLSNTFTPMTIWYIRRASRVPLLGQFILNYDVVDQSTAVDTTLDRITVAGTYVTGDQVKLSATVTLPGGVTAGTVYSVIVGSGYIKLATTLAHARAGTAIDLTTSGSGALSVSLAANQTIIDATVLDIPEFVEFVIQWAKCRCLEKDSDPRVIGASTILEALRGQMVVSLTEKAQDDENLIEADLSAYRDMS